MAKRRSKYKKATCGCNAYPFPHRVGGGRCNKRKEVRLTSDVKRRIKKRKKRATREGRYLANR